MNVKTALGPEQGHNLLIPRDMEYGNMEKCHLAFKKCLRKPSTHRRKKKHIPDSNDMALVQAGDCILVHSLR